MNAQKIKPSSEQRRLALLEQVQRQRALLILTGRDISDAISSLEVGVHAAKGSGKLKLFGLGALVALLILQPKRALWILKAGYSGWRFWKKLV